MPISIFLVLAACHGLRPLGLDTDVAAEADESRDPDGDAGGETDEGGDTDARGDTDAGGDTDTGGSVELPPCTFAIPSSADAVRSSTSRVDDGAVMWVCRNKTLSYAGDGGTVYLEQ